MEMLHLEAHPVSPVHGTAFTPSLNLKALESVPVLPHQMSNLLPTSVEGL